MWAWGCLWGLSLRFRLYVYIYVCMYVCLSVMGLRLKYTSLRIVYEPSARTSLDVLELTDGP